MPRFRKTTEGPSEEELDKRFSPTVTLADGVRSSALDWGAKLSKAHAAMAAREASRTAWKYGVDSKQAAVAQASANADSRMAALALGDAQRSRIAIPSVSSTTLLVHGRVLASSTGLGITGLTASAADARGRVLHRTTTDENGYFKLELGEAATKTGVILTGAGAEAERESPPTDAAKATSMPALTGLRLAISAGDNHPLYRTDLPDLYPGDPLYREIPLDR